ncbi:hypothetical protein [Clostridium thermarum]|uniref:hypothetical protein n=1 Tax=Clostridium thermarum TaxID=1716543 RepID=UPI0013D7218F|nr:hypothetical protein [Clostridium thermarum]
MKKLKSKISLIVAFLFLFSLLPSFSLTTKAESFIAIDGIKDARWSALVPLASSDTAGWEGFDIGNFYLTNDRSNLYFWVDAVNVPNWGDNGQLIDIALNVNGEDSGYDGNPWVSQYNFSGTDVKPNIHIMFRVKGDNEINWVSVYKIVKGAPVEILNFNDLQGAAFAVNREKGFEGSIPLNVLGLNYNDIVKGIVVLSGNNEAEHGAFDVSPATTGNNLADSWNESTGPNVQSIYSNAYTISSGPKLNIVIDGQKDALWNTLTPMGTSLGGGWQGFNIDNFYLGNDYENLYFWVDAVNVPNWGDNGQLIDIALNVNEVDSSYDGNPWASQYNYSGTDVKPNIHIMFRVKGDNQINWVSVYKAEEGTNNEILNFNDLQGAAFAVDRTIGFEGKIPLDLLGLKPGDKVKGIVVLSGNNNAEHGVFDVIPKTDDNAIAAS